MSGNNLRLQLDCAWRLGRRRFLASAGGTLLAARLHTSACSTLLMADEASESRRCRVDVVFVGPSAENYWMSWPGARFHPEDVQQECISILRDAASQRQVQLTVHPLPVDDPEGVSQCIAQVTDARPDGLIVIPLHLKSWPQVREIAAHRGDLPTIVFAPLGTAFADRLRPVRELPRTLAVTTDQLPWLGTGLRMLQTLVDLRQFRICVASDAAEGDRTIASIGTVVHFVPLRRWVEATEQATEPDMVEAMVKHYAIESRAMVEPDQDALVLAARNYVAARQLMADEGCQAISVDCSPLVKDRLVGCGPCLAWSRLLDEGCIAACEADADAAVTLLLASRMFDRPGFMQDPAPNSVHNTIVASHCTCATRLHGYDSEPARFALRSHAESDTGVALSVEWPEQEPVTLVKFERPASLWVGTGRVVTNLAAQDVGGCRTAVEIAVDGLRDARDFPGFHQVVVCGSFERELTMLAELASLQLRRLSQGAA